MLNSLVLHWPSFYISCVAFNWVCSSQEICPWASDRQLTCHYGTQSTALAVRMSVNAYLLTNLSFRGKQIIAFTSSCIVSRLSGKKGSSLNVFPTFDSVPKRVCAACENKLILLNAFPSSIVPTSVHCNTINNRCKSGANHSVQHRSVCLPKHTSFRLFNDCFAHTNLFIHMTKIFAYIYLPEWLLSLFNAVLPLNSPSPPLLYIFTRVSQSRPHQSHLFFSFSLRGDAFLLGLEA